MDLEITLGFKPSWDWITQTAKQFGVPQQSAGEFKHTTGCYFFNLYGLIIEPEMVGILFGDLCWETPLQTLTEPLTTNKYWMLTFVFSDDSHTCNVYSGTTTHQVNAHKSTLFYSSQIAATMVWPPKKRSRFVSISFSRDWLYKKLEITKTPVAHSLINLLESETGIFFRGLPLFERMNAFDILLKENNSLTWALTVEAQCYELIHDFINQLMAFKSDEANNNIQDIDKKNVMDVENRYFLATQPLPKLPFLAREAHMSLSKFKHCFRQIYGASPYEYHLNLKLDIAAVLLQQDKWLVSEIAGQLGYASIASFNKIFKKKFKMNPTDFIKERMKSTWVDTDLSAIIGPNVGIR